MTALEFFVYGTIAVACWYALAYVVRYYDDHEAPRRDHARPARVESDGMCIDAARLGRGLPRVRTHGVADRRLDRVGSALPVDDAGRARRRGEGRHEHPERLGRIALDAREGMQ